MKPGNEADFGREQILFKLSEDLEGVGSMSIHRSLIIHFSSKLSSKVRYSWWRHDDKVLRISGFLGFWNFLYGRRSSNRNNRRQYWRNDSLSLSLLFELLLRYSSGLSLLGLDFGGILLLVGLWLVLGHDMMYWEVWL